jgi:hypothetical protein
MASVTDDKVVAEVVEHLAPAHPGLSTEFLARRARENLGSFVNPSVRDYLPVLVERRVARELKLAEL